MRQHLQRLSDAVLLHLHALDKTLSAEKTIAQDTSRKLAEIANWLELENDRIRYGILGIDFRQDDKPKAVRRLLAARKRSAVG